MNKTSVSILAVIAILAVICFLCVAVTGAGVYLYNRQPQAATPSQAAHSRPDILNNPTIAPPQYQYTASPSLVATPDLGQPSIDAGAIQTEKILNTTTVPVSDLRDLAGRLSLTTDIPETMPGPAVPHRVGDHQSFYATNTDTNVTFQVQATIQYVTPHLYFWIEDSVPYQAGDLKNLAETFETKIYPTDHEFFGSEWTPGIDNDVHLYILFVRDIGGSIAGYFSSSDEYPPQARKFSNAHEMFFINADLENLADQFTYSVLAHEFQHMIHWYRDRNEESWMNEGFSVLAEFLNHYDVGGFDVSFAGNPDLQLDDWPSDHSDTVPHYGAGFLFLAYFLDRFGEDATKAVVAEQSNGLDSIDTVLSNLKKIDPQTKKPITADDVFGDWVVANYLHDPAPSDGRFTYHNYPAAPSVSDTEKIDRCPIGPQNRHVSQYGTDYIKISCAGSFTLNFSGSTEVNVIPENPHSGSFAFWSNKGDESDMTLTRSFDFTQQSGPLTLDFWTWYDIEKDYDYVYLEAKEAGGNWQILKTPSGTGRDVAGNSYGWGYNGESNIWIEEKVDLSQFSGKKVDLRFEYVTDEATNGEGFMLDDISIPQAQYHTDFEADAGGWDPAGFVRIENQLPQKFRLQLIKQGNQTSVQEISLKAGNSADIPIQIGQGVKDVVLVVSGITRFTRQAADYQFSIQK